MQTSILNDSLPRDAASRRLVDPVEALADLPSIQFLEMALDVMTGCLSFVLVYRLFLLFKGAEYLVHPLRHVAAVGIMFSFIAILLLDRSGAYRASGGLLQVRETACILEAATFSMLLSLPCSLLSGKPHWAAFFAVDIPILSILLIVEKHLLHAALGLVRKRGYGLRRVLIYGSGSAAKSVFSALSRSPKLGLHPVAIVDDGSGRASMRVNESSYRNDRFLISTSGGLRASFLRAHDVDLVILASRPRTEEEMLLVLDESKEANATVIFAADTQVVQSGSIDYLDLDGHVIYGLHRVQRKQIHEIASRLLDILVSCTLLTIIAPVLLLIAAVVKMDSSGPAFFRQIRIGKGGKPFTIIKFRTMHSELCGYDRSPGNSSDPRITRVGRWLRKTSLDELPQLINIACGQMGLVGPRPEMPFIVAGYTPEQRQRLSVRPGLTGFWQLSADRCHPIHENIQYDLYYLKHRSVFVDAAILLHTLLFAMHGT